MRAARPARLGRQGLPSRAAAEVGRLVKEETEHTKRVEAFGPTIAKTMGSVEDKSLQIAGYTGRSGGVKAKNEQAFEKSCEAMSSAFAASLTAEYKRAWLEGRRELLGARHPKTLAAIKNLGALGGSGRPRRR